MLHFCIARHLRTPSYHHTHSEAFEKQQAIRMARSGHNVFVQVLDRTHISRTKFVRAQHRPSRAHPKIPGPRPIAIYARAVAACPKTESNDLAAEHCDPHAKTQYVILTRPLAHPYHGVVRLQRHNPRISTRFGA